MASLFQFLDYCRWGDLTALSSHPPATNPTAAAAAAAAATTAAATVARHTLLGGYLPLPLPLLPRSLSCPQGFLGGGLGVSWSSTNKPNVYIG